MTNAIFIPEHELEITTSRSGGPGGQHVNKTSSRITVHWNVKTTSVLSDEQKERILRNLGNRLTSEGHLVVHNSESRSQLHNKKLAIAHLHKLIEKALWVPKKRMKTKTPQVIKEARLQAKKQRSQIKKMRAAKHSYD